MRGVSDAPHETPSRLRSRPIAGVRDLQERVSQLFVDLGSIAAFLARYISLYAQRVSSVCLT